MYSPQNDLFEDAAVPGLATRADFLALDEERALIAMIDSVELTPFRFQGWFGKRLTASFGWHYDFDRARVAPADAMPEWVLPIRERAARFAGLAPDDLVQLLLIRYDPGAGIGWHRDRPVFDHVIGISLGAATTMRFRRRKPSGFDRFNVPLAPGSIYHLSREARYDWEHSIAGMDQTRWSITFRSLKAGQSFRLTKTLPA